MLWEFLMLVKKQMVDEVEEALQDVVEEVQLDAEITLFKHRIPKVR